MSSGDMKGFYRQRKKSGASSGGMTKPSPKKAGRGRGSGATLAGLGPAQPAALISHGSVDLKEDYGAAEEKLRQFDMDMRYGPCLGMTRMERWARASRLGLDPPSEVEALLRGSGAGGVSQECLWEGRV